ncbi:MAG TPA: hypothetical protein PLP23_17500 [Panacibacter sp.]|nr:hypothetical protein [Panacibacter sp.]
MRKVNRIIILYSIYIGVSLLSLFYFLTPSLDPWVIKKSSSKSNLIATIEGISEALGRAGYEIGDIIQRLFYYAITMSAFTCLLFISINILQKEKFNYGFIFLVFIDISIAFFACYLSQFFPAFFDFFKNGEELFILIFISFIAANIYFYNKYYKSPFINPPLSPASNW